MEYPPKIARHRAAIGRNRLSRPLRLAMDAGALEPGATVLDYGCGRGDDVKRMRKLGIDAVGWDPHYCPDNALRPSRVVNLGYVLNVIEEPAERLTTLDSAWKLAESSLIVSALVTVDARGGAVPYGDGVISSKGTFQYYYDQQELENTLRSRLGVEPVALAMGVFAVVKDADLRSELLARQFRHTSRIDWGQKAQALFEENKNTLQSLIDFLEQRGRWPVRKEYNNFTTVMERFGSIGRAIRLVEAMLPEEATERAARAAKEDLLVYLALARFHKVPKFSELGETVQRDVRALFGSLHAADEQASALLFSVGDRWVRLEAAQKSEIGKQIHQALYVHSQALDVLPPALRVFEGCARRLLGGLEGANMVKLGLHEPTISYLSYPRFETDPHPALERSLKIDLRTFRPRIRDYREYSNPPILHRKELFVRLDHSSRPKFARLTAQEERGG